FSSRRRHTRFSRDWSSDVCSSDLIKKKANPKAEYSILYPATSSPSASGKSKGGLFVSAKAEIKNIKNKGKNGIKFQITSCCSTILIKFKDPVYTIIVKIIKPIETS